MGLELTLREARRFQMEELSSATKNFSDRNLIGEGKFGEVYKGLLHDGMLVAIKKRAGGPSQEFTEEVVLIFSSSTSDYYNFIRMGSVLNGSKLNFTCFSFSSFFDC